MPPSFPFSAVQATRAYWWVYQISTKRARHLAAALLDAVWIDGVDITDRHVIVAMAADLGIDTDGLTQALDSPELKDLTRQRVQEAVDTQLFGSPWVIVDGEAFWGNDRLDDIAHWLETGGW